ncbi:MAG: cytochrome c peroxidase [Rhodoferax sp.]
MKIHRSLALWRTAATKRLLRRGWIMTSMAVALLSGCGGGGAGDASVAATESTDTDTVQAQAVPLSNDRARLGQAIFGDTDLSEPRGTACVACHQPSQGFAGNHGSRIGVAQGSLPTSLGLRNAMPTAYSARVPALHFVTADGETEAQGGHFWDGRVDTLAQQALGPLLNPLEMNNPSKRAVVDKIAAARYAPLFRQVFGATVFNDTEAAFASIGVAVEAFEREALQPFSSKFDAMVRGQVSFTPAEARGMALFMDPRRANCAGCHKMNPGSGKPQDSLFSDFTYYATGIPRNTAIPRNANAAFFDLGLCGPERAAPTLPTDVVPGVTIDNFCGKFRMPTLRNVAERPAYMHNGFFKDLSEVVRFYSTRASNPQRWYGPRGVPNDLPTHYLGNVERTKAPFNRRVGDAPLLNDGEVADIVAFLHTLSDGFRAP